MSSPREPNKASSSKLKGKAIDPSEHPNISDGGGNADEADKDKDKEDAEPITEENAVKLPNPAASSNEVPSSKSKGKAVDPTEHPNGGGNVDEADKDEDEDKEDAEPINEENAVNPPNPATSSNAKKTFGMHKAQSNARRGIISSLHLQLRSDGIC